MSTSGGPDHPAEKTKDQTPDHRAAALATSKNAAKYHQPDKPEPPVNQAPICPYFSLFF
jgi:hypothetical protein